MIRLGCMDDATIFHVWHDGERAAGLSGDSAKVEMHLPPDFSSEEMQEVKVILAEAIGKIWDWPQKYIHVLTEKELQLEEAQIQAAEEEAFWSDEVQEKSSLVICSLCKNFCEVGTAHLHQDEYIGNDCCWDERLKASE